MVATEFGGGCECLTYFVRETDRLGTKAAPGGGEEEKGERVGEGSECRGTSVSDVQISVRHCSDVTIVNTHSDGLRRGRRNY